MISLRLTYESDGNVRAYLLSEELRAHFGYCFYNAIHNKAHRYKHLNLRLVMGSVGIGYDCPFYEYGNPKWGWVKEFKRGRLCYDAHCWLEDDQGRVYDAAHPDIYKIIAAKHDNEISDEIPHEIFGTDKYDLLCLGLYYEPAPKKTQRRIIAEFERAYPAHEAFLKHYYGGC